MKRLFAILILLAVSVAAAPAQTPCPRCGKVHAVKRAAETAQEFAQREVDLMVRLGRLGHHLGVAPGCRFAGVGYSYSPHNIPTCTPKSRMTLVADAKAYCPRTRRWYRSRHWR